MIITPHDQIDIRTDFSNDAITYTTKGTPNPTILYAIQAKRLSCTKRQDNLFFDLRNITGKDMISKTGAQIEAKGLHPLFYPLHGLNAIISVAKSSEAQITFTTGAKSDTRRTHDIGFIQQLIKKFP